MKYRTTLLSFFLLFTFASAFSQITDFTINDKIPNTKGFDKNPVTLANKLIEGKNTDKDKFDAIFTWVTHNIKYDYFLYLSNRGATTPRVGLILKNKMGICVDYAYLMDTLCKIAGIENVSVYGYAKDNLYDIHDSIYYDNHAWNAVRLDNQWYVYDATWSSGQYYLDLTKFGKLISKIKLKQFLKRKSKTLRFQAENRSRCEITEKFYTKKIEIWPLKNQIIFSILNIIPLRLVKKYQPDTTHYFYLTNPDTFAITHYPDNPYWSLTSKYKTFRAFESDSIMYYYSDTLYKNQKRKGSYCNNCNSFLSMNEMEKNKELKINSLKLNDRNKFAPGMCDFNIATIYLKKAIPETDSTTKVNTLDSAITYYGNSKQYFKKAKQSVTYEYYFHYKKNSKKRELMLNENRQNRDYVYGIMNQTNLKTRKIKKFINITDRSLDKFVKIKDKLSDIQELKYKSQELLGEKAIQLTNTKFKNNLQKIDSLNTKINSLISFQKNALDTLSNNLWGKNILLDSLTKTFGWGSYYRQQFLLDNYKKQIVDLRKNTSTIKRIYAQDVTKSIFNLSDSVSNIGLQIIELMFIRNKYIKENISLLQRLIIGKIVEKDSVKNYIETSKNYIQNDICWITGGSAALKAVAKGYKLLLIKQKSIIYSIGLENKAERKRYTAINSEINRRKSKFANIASLNIKIANYNAVNAKKLKREYLKKLKEERQKE